ncbi:binding-protein-dependent transport system inner membrane protein [Liquorilactobacillus uvarum DSM 19971]|uniref:Binding-protein-dependent transport system inner membrane protein n=1 Tax=Liquorilactobacillus uvarum DSM 19971 TaxID=1423812 RepID=A0A0R1PL05_9LACO|nr:binding-protein-dependent transport system inner membrane protein [Liquorilactobacillus uvarum DSM 19971]
MKTLSQSKASVTDKKHETEELFKKKDKKKKSSFWKKVLVPQKRIPKKVSLTLSILSFVVIIILWCSITYGKIVGSMFVPTPGDTLKAMGTMFSNGFWSDIGITVYRVMAGFLIALVIAIPLGILVGAYSPLAAIFEPVFSFIRYMPASAFIPLFIFWIGIGESEKIAIIILGSLPQLVLMIANDIRNVEKSLIEVSYTLGTNTFDVLWKIILPKSLPDIMNTIRIVLGWAWTYVIVAEIVGASAGIGFSILQAQRTFQVDSIFVGILTLGIIGLIVDTLLTFLNKKIFAWNF